MKQRLTTDKREAIVSKYWKLKDQIRRIENRLLADEELEVANLLTQAGFKKVRRCTAVYRLGEIEVNATYNRRVDDNLKRYEWHLFIDGNYAMTGDLDEILDYVKKKGMNHE